MDQVKNALMVFLLLCFIVIKIHAQEIRYITDQFEITLQKSKNPNSQVVARLKSGAPVEILQEAGTDGYVKVSTFDNKVGWVLDSLLMEQPGGRDQHFAIKREYDTLKAEFDKQVNQRTDKLSTELEQLKQLSKRPLQLQEENQKLKKMLEDERARIEQIKIENQEFKSIHKDRQWLITGAMISIGSLILGLIITKIPWRRRKSWGEV